MNNNSYLVQLCKKAYLEGAQLPSTLDFWSCYHLLWHEQPPFECEWGHHPFSCVLCAKECVPKKKCAHHGFDRK